MCLYSYLGLQYGDDDVDRCVTPNAVSNRNHKIAPVWQQRQPRVMSVAMLLLLLVLLCAVAHTAGASSQSAFVTVMYGEDEGYFLACKVMLRTLRRHTRNDVLIIAVKDKYPRSLLAEFEELGAQILERDMINNPFLERVPGASRRYSGLLMKFWAWKLTQYERIAYIDSDVLIRQSIDPMLQCGAFCAAFIGPCYFNAGVFVAKPSLAVYDDLMQKLGVLDSYDGGDQGFLNMYFHELVARPLFVYQPNRSRAVDDDMLRLPIEYNVHHSFFYNRMDWIPRCLTPRLLHFPGPAFKPWHWYSYPVLTELHRLWQAERVALPWPMQQNHYGYGLCVLLPMPPLLLATKYVHEWWLRWRRNRGGGATIDVTVQLVAKVQLLSLISYGVAFFAPFLVFVPTFPPLFGWCLFLEWHFVLVNFCMAIGTALWLRLAPAAIYPLLRQCLFATAPLVLLEAGFLYLLTFPVARNLERKIFLVAVGAGGSALLHLALYVNLMRRGNTTELPGPGASSDR